MGKMQSQRLGTSFSRITCVRSCGKRKLVVLRAVAALPCPAPGTNPLTTALHPNSGRLAMPRSLPSSPPSSPPASSSASLPDPAPVPHRAMSLASAARCLPLLLLLFLTAPASFADTLPADILLPPVVLSASHPFLINRVLPSATSLRIPVRAPPNRTLLIEAWHPSTDPTPHPLLLVGTLPPPVVQTAADAPRGVYADFEAFWTRRSYAYLFISNHTDLHIRLYEHHNAFGALLNATIRISLVSQDACPTGPGTSLCSGKGTCRAGECVCEDGHAGRYCEARIRNLSVEPFNVPSDRMVYFRYDVPQNGSIAIRLQLLTDSAHPPTGQPIMYVKRAYENGGTQLATGPPLPSIYDAKFDDRASILGHLPVQTVVRGNLQKGDRLYVGVYNVHKPILFIRRHHGITAGLLTSYNPVQVHLEAFPCAVRKLDGVRRCPASGQESWDLSLTFLLLPLLLGTLTLLTMVVCVSVWAGVFRQQIFEVIHGHAPEDIHTRRDKLSEAEVNAMFPAFVFTKGETAALGATGDVCCSVCLCSFEEGELLRRLACGHSYHSTCLDRWLLTNATCPRCRKSARIHGEVGRGWLIRRYAMRLVGRLHGGFAWISGLFWSSPRARETPELESVEVEGLLPNREDGMSRRITHTS